MSIYICEDFATFQRAGEESAEVINKCVILCNSGILKFTSYLHKRHDDTRKGGV